MPVGFRGMLLWLAAAATLCAPAAGRAERDPVQIAKAQNATIGLITGDSGGTDARIAADIADILDDPGSLRVLPIRGHGGLQDIADLNFLKGIDVAIVDTGTLAQRDTLPKAGSLQYIAKLYQEEIHVLAADSIKTLSDLGGKPIGIGSDGGNGALTAMAMFGALHINPVLQPVPERAALDLLRRGELAAIVVPGGDPVPLLLEIPPGTGLHFLPVAINAALLEHYLPAKLDPVLYPNLMQANETVDTIASGAVLMTLSAPPDSLRARRVNRFVDMLFARLGRFRGPGNHPKWQEVNPAAQLPGWTRYPEAQGLLTRQADAREKTLRSAFETYLRQSGQAAAGETREALFREYLHWRDEQPAR